ncbi:HEAT repeat domain-containing protein [Nonomuraea insulae]|uniref:HEAT repeat domain-containing protein n=1 Tax=Nonomuraea insulae TaxID=1616787 RepID=A0ABW1DAN6_9ACTN
MGLDDRRRRADRARQIADPATAVPPLVTALSDTNLDVRKAAVLASAPWAGAPEVTEALRSALTDTDADVRAHARHALTSQSHITA